MKQIILLSLAMLIVACSPKKYFSNSSKITPIASPKTLAEKMGDGEYVTKTIYIPMTSASIHHYDYDAIMEREDVKEESSLGSLMEGLKVGFFNLGLNFVNMDKVRVSSMFDFGFIDTEVIKEVRVKNVFFNIKGCNKKLKTCQKRRKDKELSLSFLEEIFINFSPVNNNEYTEEVKVEAGVKNFKKHSKMAFRPSLKKDLTRDSKGMGILKDFNIANYKFEKKDEMNSTVEDVFMLKIEQDYLYDVKQTLRSKEYAHLVKTTQLIGDNVYIKLLDKSLKPKFRVKFEKEHFFTNGRVLSMIECSSNQCLNFNVNRSNLMSLIEKSSMVKVDTFLNLKRITKTDFEYQGLIELEIKIRM